MASGWVCVCVLRLNPAGPTSGAGTPCVSLSAHCKAGRFPTHTVRGAWYGLAKWRK